MGGPRPKVLLHVCHFHLGFCPCRLLRRMQMAQQQLTHEAHTGIVWFARRCHTRFLVWHLLVQRLGERHIHAKCRAPLSRWQGPREKTRKDRPSPPPPPPPPVAQKKRKTIAAI